MDSLWPWLVLLTGAIVTYAWRGLGVALSGRLHPTGWLFETLSCIAHALLAALIARMIFLPAGGLQETTLSARLVTVAVALAAFYLSGKRLIVGVLAGATTLMAILLLVPGALTV